MEARACRSGEGFRHGIKQSDAEAEEMLLEKAKPSVVSDEKRSAARRRHRRAVSNVHQVIIAFRMRCTDRGRADKQRVRLGDDADRPAERDVSVLGETASPARIQIKFQIVDFPDGMRRRGHHAEMGLSG
jgi:hypothetical protein